MYILPVHDPILICQSNILQKSYCQLQGILRNHHFSSVGCGGMENNSVTNANPDPKPVFLHCDISV